MLFLSEDIYARRRKLLKASGSGELADEAFHTALLELDPNDFHALVWRGKTRLNAGDPLAAEQCFWRAIEANPCAPEPYLALTQMFKADPESQALADGLAELAILRMSHTGDDDFLKGIDKKAGLKGERLAAFRGLPAKMRAQVIASSFRDQSPDMPEATVERLRPLRLIGKVQEGHLDAETVDAIVAEGSAMVPLLVGVLRAWAQDFLEDEDGDVGLENALALLGETGSPEAISHLLEFIGLNNATAAGASSWALRRIVERHPGESGKYVAPIVAQMDCNERLEIADLIVHHPEFDLDGKLLEALGKDLRGWVKDDLDVFFPLLLIAMVLARGIPGMRQGRALVRQQGALLSRHARTECEDLLAACEAGLIPESPPQPSAFTVYEICSGEATWDEDPEDDEGLGWDEDELSPQQPVRRKVTPGRNDPCWCNSGKKYKKCHLDSDAANA